MKKLEFKVTFIYGQNLRSLPAAVQANILQSCSVLYLAWVILLNHRKSSKPHQLYVGINEIFKKEWEG